MDYVPFSPFKRPITYAHLSAVEEPDEVLPVGPVNKWEILRELSKGQTAFGVTERDLTVLQGLLSFFPDENLGGNSEMIVFPSNKAICERLNGMADSTMRRHLSRLIEAGLISRRDSPNGKRFARRTSREVTVFGFDLAPLHLRSQEISHAAEAAREAQERLQRLRETVSLMRRDLAAVAEFGAETLPGDPVWDQFADLAALTARGLRRKLGIDDLEAIRTELCAALETARNHIDGPDTEELNTNAVCSEQHYQNSNTYSLEFEPCLEKAMAAGVQEAEPTGVTVDRPEEGRELEREGHTPRIPLHIVTTACPSLGDFYDGSVRHWHQLYDAACRIRPAMGISPSAWEEAKKCMGPEQASVVVAAILERFDEINSPGGYLRSLSAKAEAGEFSCGPMVMALIGRKKAA